MVKAVQILLPEVPTGGFESLRRFVNNRMLRPAVEGRMAKDSKQKDFGKCASRRQKEEQIDQMSEQCRKQSTKDMFSQHQAEKVISNRHHKCRCGETF